MVDQRAIHQGIPQVIIALLICLDLSVLATNESGNNPASIGDRGAAHGAFQMHSRAWADVSASRIKRGLRVWSFAAAHNYQISSIYASEYLQTLQFDFTTAQGHRPTEQQLYCLWNLGFEGFKRRGFSVQNCPEITKRSAKNFK
jgi:hypothetical protein